MKFLLPALISIIFLAYLVNCASNHFSIEGRSPLLRPPTGNEINRDDDEVIVALNLPSEPINHQTDFSGTSLVPLKKVEAGGRISYVSLLFGLLWIADFELVFRIIASIFCSFIILIESQYFIGYSFLSFQRIEYDPAEGSVPHIRFLAIPIFWVTEIIFFATLHFRNLFLSTSISLLLSVQILFVLGSFHERCYRNGRIGDNSVDDSYVSV